MKADLLQALTICTHGNAFLRSDDGRPPELLAISPFASTKEIEFRRVGTSPAPQLVADSVAPWFRKLQTEGVIHLRLHAAPLLMDPRALTTEAWGVATEGNRGVELWTPYWRTRINHAQDPRPHIISYTGERVSRWLLPAPHPIEEVRPQLIHQLDVTISSIQAVGANHAAIPLVHCRSLSQHGNTSLRSHREVFPDSIDDSRKRLAAEAIRIAQTLNATAWLDLIEPLDETVKEQIQELWKVVLMAFEAVAG